MRQEDPNHHVASPPPEAGGVVLASAESRNDWPVRGVREMERSPSPPGQSVWVKPFHWCMGERAERGYRLEDACFHHRRNVTTGALSFGNLTEMDERDPTDPTVPTEAKKAKGAKPVPQSTQRRVQCKVQSAKCGAKGEKLQPPTVHSDPVPKGILNG